MSSEKKFDPSFNLLYRQHEQLDALFSPKSVAVIGATEREDSVGRTVLWNLLRSPFGGTIYPVNLKRKSILGIKAYPTIGDVPEKVDLAVIVTPAKFVPGVIKECVEADVSSAIIISAGFKELGESGIQLEEEIRKYTKNQKIRIIGPNCLGVMNPLNGLNATFAADMALKGNIAFISQSGALCTAVLDWSLREKVGFSSFVSIGSMLDVDWGDLITYLGNDDNTKSILIYMESVGNPRSFLSAARKIAISKPIILIKAGVTEESAKAAASHTGALTGSDEVFNAALRRVGVVRVPDINSLFSLAEILSKQPNPTGPHLTIITNAGGPGVIATDALIENGGKLAKLTDKTYQQLNEFLPAEWSHNNPVDILGDASADLYAKTVETIAKDPQTEGILVILTPQYMTDSEQTAMKLKDYAKLENKPVLASFMGADAVKKGNQILINAQIPTFEYPDEACRTFAYMWNYSYNLQGIYETPVESGEFWDLKALERKEKVKKIIDNCYEKNTLIIDEFTSKEILDIYRIPVVQTKIATSCDEAIKLAEEMGYPVVLKVYSNTITHKTDVGGVKLNLHNKEMVKKAYEEIVASLEKHNLSKEFEGVTVQQMIKIEGFELIFGSSIDSEFGPVLLFGTGGELVEVFKDRALGLPPLTTTLAHRMMAETKIFKALQGVRGRGAIDFDLLEKILVRFSNLIAQHPRIKECDINPLIAGEDKIIALDARIILYEKDEAFPKLAIRPYPTKYIQKWALDDKTECIIRPIRPEDEPLIIDFYKDLSERTIRQRYLEFVNYDDLIARDRLIRICFNDYEQEIALVTERVAPDGKKEILGVLRLTRIPGTNDANFALIVHDSWQKKGIGTRLMNIMIQVAEHEKISAIVAQMLPENVEMQGMCKKVGFEIMKKEGQPFIFAKKKIGS